jgi:hypothetical protein
MKEYINNKHKTYYTDRFLQSPGPVYLLHDLIGKKVAVELGSVNLGSTEEDINRAFKEIFKTYPEDKFYCIFYTTTEYKSEKAKKEFLEKYYKGNSRIPETYISAQDMNYTDSFGLRIAFVNREDYEKRHTYFDSFDFKEYEEQVVFFKYYDDSLYQKEKENAQKWFEKHDKYLLTPLNKNDYLIKRHGFIRDIGKNIKKLKEATEEKYGDLFISWETSIDICLKIQEHNNQNYIVIREKTEEDAVSFFKKDYNSLTELAFDKKFKTEKEVTQFIKDNLAVQRLMILPEEVTEKIYDDHIIIDLHDWLRLPTSSLKQQQYNLKNWSDVQSTFANILEQNAI